MTESRRGARRRGTRSAAGLVLAFGLVAGLLLTAVPRSSVAVAQTPTAQAAGLTSVVAAAPTPDGGGFWAVDSAGQVEAEGDATFYGDLTGTTLNAPIVSITATRDGHGYWLLGADGGVFSFGDAQFFGSTGNLHLNSPALEIIATADSGGYWFVAADGGVFAFGDAAFYGSTGGVALNQPVVGMAATPDGDGYWLVAADGGIFAFGDARFFGSTGGIALDQPVVGLASTTTGDGYWLVAADGGIFAFGDATFHGSGAGNNYPPVVSIIATGDGGGYWLIDSDGGIEPFGDAPGLGLPLPTPIPPPPVDPGTLPQTDDLPQANTPQFDAEMEALWSGIVADSVTPAMPAFFPESAYLQVKAIANPAGDYAQRLVGEYGLDIGAAHALLGADPAEATFVGVDVNASFAHWVVPGTCSNAIGYYELPNSRLVYEVAGQTLSFGIASMISWRGVWYVVHLGGVQRNGPGGMVDDPEVGPGVPAYSSTC
jgi:hypothetical protein